MLGRRKRKKQTAAPENLTESGIYYKKLADKYHIAVRILTVLFLIFVISMLLTGYKALKGENFRYLGRAIGLGVLSAETPYANISYTADNGTMFALYEENLAVAGNGSIALYHPSGELLFQEDTGGMTSIDTSGKYMAAYVPGSKTLSLYHSFAKIHTQTTEFPIGTVAVADNGMFAVSVTDASGGAVYVYDSDFRLTYTWMIEGGFVFDLAISPDGKSVAAMILSFSSGSYFTELTVKNIRTDGTVVSENFEGKTPVCVEFFSNGGFFASVDGMISFYRTSGEKISQTEVSAKAPLYSMDGSAVAVLLSSSQAIIYSQRGSILADISLNGKIFDLDYHNEVACFLSETAVYFYDTATDAVREYPIHAGVLDLFLLDDGSLLLCYPSYVERLSP